MACAASWRAGSPHCPDVEHCRVRGGLGLRSHAERFTCNGATAKRRGPTQNCRGQRTAGGARTRALELQLDVYPWWHRRSLPLPDVDGGSTARVAARAAREASGSGNVRAAVTRAIWRALPKLGDARSESRPPHAGPSFHVKRRVSARAARRRAPPDHDNAGTAGAARDEARSEYPRPEESADGLGIATWQWRARALQAPQQPRSTAHTRPRFT